MKERKNERKEKKKRSKKPVSNLDSNFEMTNKIYIVCLYVPCFFSFIFIFFSQGNRVKLSRD